MDPMVIDNLIIPIAGMLTGIVLGMPLIRAAVRYIERRTGGEADPKLRAQVEEVRSRLDGMEELRERVLDLEERIDFTERVLARTKDQRLVSGE
jgi:hypothetical protein